jgi:His-Xaa-Ser system protein HxsD
MESDDCLKCYVVEVDSSIYTPESIKNASYKYIDSFFINIRNGDSGEIVIQFEPQNATYTRGDMEKTLRAFMNDLLDHQIRIDLEERFRSLRERIYKCAFASIEENG